MNIDKINEAVLAVIKQGRASVHLDSDGEISCAYRGNNGCKCMIGQLIPDDIYTAEAEGYNVPWLFGHGRFNEIASYLSGIADSQLLQSLQRAHDSSSRCKPGQFLELFKFKVVGVYQDNNLPVPDFLEQPT